MSDFQNRRPSSPNQLHASIKETVPAETYTPEQTVTLKVIAETDLGYKCIVDGTYWGMLYYNEVFQTLFKNQELPGFIKQVREDGKLDLILYKAGSKGSEDIGEKIMDKLKSENGFLDFNEKTTPERIYDTFGVSKKKYKMALGGLYKKRLIVIKEDGIYLAK